jgi:hypothetical protein
MNWAVVLCDEFAEEFMLLEPDLRTELAARFRVLETFGPNLGRPTVDTLNGSKFPNMKELRFIWRRNPYRYFFAFDPERKAVVLVGGNKSGVKRFYEACTPVADARFDKYLRQLENQRRKP